MVTAMRFISIQRSLKAGSPTKVRLVDDHPLGDTANEVGARPTYAKVLETHQHVRMSIQW